MQSCSSARRSGRPPPRPVPRAGRAWRSPPASKRSVTSGRPRQLDQRAQRRVGVLDAPVGEHRDALRRGSETSALFLMSALRARADMAWSATVRTRARVDGGRDMAPSRLLPERHALDLLGALCAARAPRLGQPDEGLAVALGAGQARGAEAKDGGRPAGEPCWTGVLSISMAASPTPTSASRRDGGVAHDAPLPTRSRGASNWGLISASTS